MRRFLSAAFVVGALVLSLKTGLGSSLSTDFAQADAFFVNRVEPQYPQTAKDRFIEGNVTIAVRVNSSGHVLGAQVARSSGHALLDEAALRAAVESSYVHSRAGMTYSVEYTFRIGGMQRRAGAMMMR